MSEFRGYRDQDTSNKSKTMWATCAVCELTTDPTANLPGGRSGRDVAVIGELGNGEWCMSGAGRMAISGVSTSGCNEVTA